MTSKTTGTAAWATPSGFLTLTLPLTVLDWLRRGERGLSSEFIVEHLWGLPLLDDDFEPAPHPVDPADLRRCVKLLDASPETRAALARMTGASPSWRELVTAWGVLETMLREEIGATLPARQWSAPKTYAAMKAVLSLATPAA